MNVQPTRRNTYELNDDGRFLGELKYRNGLSYKAIIRLTNTNLYEISPKGFWGTSMTISKNGKETGSLTMKWRGNLSIHHNGREYDWEAKGFFKPRYTLKSKSDGESIRYTPTFNWRKLRFNYHVEYDRQETDPFLILLGVYAANYYMAMMSAVNS